MLSREIDLFTWTSEERQNWGIINIYSTCKALRLHMLIKGMNVDGRQVQGLGQRTALYGEQGVEEQARDRQKVRGKTGEAGKPNEEYFKGGGTGAVL